MAVYRVLKPLSGSGAVQQGDLLRFEWLPASTIEVLIAKRAIARVRPPLLAELPGWEVAAALLEPMGILDGEQLVEAICDRLAEVIEGTGVDEVTARQWQGDMLALMAGTKKNRGCGCRPT